MDGLKLLALFLEGRIELMDDGKLPESKLDQFAGPGPAWDPMATMGEWLTITLTGKAEMVVWGRKAATYTVRTAIAEMASKLPAGSRFMMIHIDHMPDGSIGLTRFDQIEVLPPSGLEISA